MVQFVIGQPVTTKVPQVTVDAGLKPGAHRFRLVVTDNDGNVSKADEVVVQVREGTLQPPGPPVFSGPVLTTGPVLTRPPIPVPVPSPPILTIPVPRPPVVPPRRPRSKK